MISGCTTSFSVTSGHTPLTLPPGCGCARNNPSETSAQGAAAAPSNFSSVATGTGRANPLAAHNPPSIGATTSGLRSSATLTLRSVRLKPCPACNPVSTHARAMANSTHTTMLEATMAGCSASSPSTSMHSGMPM